VNTIKTKVDNEHEHVMGFYMVDNIFYSLIIKQY